VDEELTSNRRRTEKARENGPLEKKTKSRKRSTPGRKGISSKGCNFKKGEKRQPPPNTPSGEGKPDAGFGRIGEKVAGELRSGGKEGKIRDERELGGLVNNNRKGGLRLHHQLRCDRHRHEVTFHPPRTTPLLWRKKGEPASPLEGGAGKGNRC